MSTNYKISLQKVYTRRINTPVQTGRKSPLRFEITILEEIELDLNYKIQEELAEELDECDLEIMAILSNTSDDSFDEDNYIHYERSKCPELVF